MDYTVSIKGKLGKTDTRCLRAIYYHKQKNLKPHKTLKPQPIPTKNNHQGGSFTFWSKKWHLRLKKNEKTSSSPLSKINSTPLTSLSERLKRSFPNVMGIRWVRRCISKRIWHIKGSSSLILKHPPRRAPAWRTGQGRGDLRERGWEGREAAPCPSEGIWGLDQGFGKHICLWCWLESHCFVLCCWSVNSVIGTSPIN